MDNQAVTISDGCRRGMGEVKLLQQEMNHKVKIFAFTLKNEIISKYL